MVPGPKAAYIEPGAQQVGALFLRRRHEEITMRTTLRSCGIVLMCGLIGSAVLAQATPPAHQILMPADLKWSVSPALPQGHRLAVIEGPLNEARPFTFRLELPANYRVAPHSHTAVERVTVLSGTFHLGMGDRFDESALKALPVGAMAIMQPGMIHFAATKEPTVIQLHGVGPWTVNYVDPKDDPRKK
jgi:hypothetical protein